MIDGASGYVMCSLIQEQLESMGKVVRKTKEEGFAVIHYSSGTGGLDGISQAW